MTITADDSNSVNRWYVQENIDGTAPFAYYMEVPGGSTRVDILTLRVSRRQGLTDADARHREKVLGVVGSITVAGGHIEAAMKRLLLVLRDDEPMFELADYQWHELEARLSRECDGSDDRRIALRGLLDWAEGKSLRERRNDAVHGAWWLFSGCEARISRWPRRADSKMYVSGFASWEELADLCWEFADRLDHLVGDDWPRAVLDDPPVNLGLTGTS